MRWQKGIVSALSVRTMTLRYVEFPASLGIEGHNVANHSKTAVPEEQRSSCSSADKGHSEISGLSLSSAHAHLQLSTPSIYSAFWSLASLHPGLYSAPFIPRRHGIHHPVRTPASRRRPRHGDRQSLPMAQVGRLIQHARELRHREAVRPARERASLRRALPGGRRRHGRPVTALRARRQERAGVLRYALRFVAWPDGTPRNAHSAHGAEHEVHGG